MAQNLSKEAFVKQVTFPVLAMALTLSACGPGGDAYPHAGGDRPPTTGNTVTTPAFEDYTTTHNNRNRIRLSRMATADATDLAAVAAFDAGNPPSPAAYKNLVAINDAKMTIEVLAKIGSDGTSVERLLRLTVDQIPLQTDKTKAITGQYYFRGASFAWVTIDNGPMLSGSHPQGLTNLVLDFDRGTANVDLRTEISGSSGVEIGLSAKDLPFNVVTGAYGGTVQIDVRNPNDATKLYNIDGSLRGNVGGDPAYNDSKHGLSTSGIFTATGNDQGSAITVDGVYHGVDPNALQ